jgi:hypothetical protein
MKQLFFWKSWPSAERITVITALITLLLAIVFFLLKIVNPLENSVRWDVLTQLEDLPVVIDALRLNSWQYGISIPSHLVSEQFVASPMEVDFLAVRIFWVLGLVGFSLLMAGITALPRLWYLTCMIVFILLTAVSRTEILGVFGVDSRALFFILLALYPGVGYYFHAFRNDLNMAIRWLSFLGISIAVAVVVAFGSGISHADLTAIAYSYPFWLLLTTLFLLISSTEITAKLVWLSTAGRATNGKNSYLNFLVISLLYISSLVLLFLKNTNRLEWETTLINPVFLALLAGLLGLTGFRARCESTEGVIPFRGSGYGIYFGLFIVSAAFVGFASSTANDPLLEVFEDVVVTSQLAMSAVFVFYVTANFFPLFRQGLPVHKVLYKPLKFGLTQTRLFGFTGVVALLSIEGLLPIYQAFAGYFNGLGDLYTVRKEYVLAEQYYKMALQQEFQNHKSNYALASLAQRQGDPTATAYYFKQATLKQPSPQAYVGLSGVLMSESLFFDALFSLREGMGKFPESGELLNNLGILYARTNVADSAYYYLQRAEKHSSHEDVPATNLLSILAKSTNTTLLDSLTQHTKQRDYLSWQANWMTVRNLRQVFKPVPFKKEAVRPDSLLNVAGLAYLINYSFNQARSDSYPATLLPRLSNANPFLSDDLLLASLYSQFYSGDKLVALDAMSVLANESSKNQQLYKKIYGHWLLQLGLYDQAVDQFSLVKGLEGQLGLVLANALSGKVETAGVLLSNLEKEENSPSIDAFRQVLSGELKVESATDSLLAVARKNNTEADFYAAVKSNPVDAVTVMAAVDFLLKKKKVKKAYQLVVDALRLNDRSGKLWAGYAMLSLEQGLLTQAEEGRENVEKFALAADYQSFLTDYQSRRALIEKEREAFQ